MDNPESQRDDPGLTEDEKLKVGLQQAALIQIQQQNHDAEIRERAMQQQMLLEQQKEQELLVAQQKALQMRREQEHLEQMAEQQKLQLLQQQALKEQQQEEELKKRQERALMEMQQEESGLSSGPPAPPRLLPPPPQPPLQTGGPPRMPAPPPPFPLAAGQQTTRPPLAPGISQQQQQPPGAPHQQMAASARSAQVPPLQRPSGPPQGPPISRPSGPPAGFSQPAQQMTPPVLAQHGQVAPLQPPPGGMPHGQQGGIPPGQAGGMPPNQQQRSQPPQQGGMPPREGQPFPQQSGQERVRPLMAMETHPPVQPGEDERKEESKQQQQPVPSQQMQQPPQQQQPQQQPDEEQPEEFKLPQALEKVLAFKDVRAQEVGVKPEEMERIEKGEIIEEVVEGEEEVAEEPQVGMRIEDYDEEEEEEEEEPVVEKTKKKESKNKKRKKKKKKSKQRKMQTTVHPHAIMGPDFNEDDDVEIEYVTEDIQIQRTDPAYREFSKIFQAFKITEPEKPKDEEPKQQLTTAQKLEGELGIKARAIKELGEEDKFGSGSEEDEKPEEEKPKLSKKKMKKLNRLSVAELKQLVNRPDVVEMHDVTARDPKLLVSLKATRNTVTVPRHWCFKRKYLAGKRGIEKPPFDLPDFIKNTGIMEMRQALQDKEEAKNLKAKMREKVRPKMGKIDIDYQKLHDAFFKYQTKPKMTIHGDLYYEGKEFETRLKEKKPGNLTDDLRTALGMPVGPNAEKYPPPWLIAMQRYGPPPSYPNLKIPGLNAPIPETCSFGYHAGGWGKPPVDETGKPLYGDVFGTQGQEAAPVVEDEDIDKTHWGELESESEEESESESESEEEGEAMDSGLVTPGDTGLVTPSGVTSVPVGMETPDMIELRKKRIEDAMDQGGDTPALYQVIPEKKTAVGGAMMGSAHVYDISGVATPAPGGGGENPEGVEVALNPDELDLDTAAMQAKYEQQVREQQDQLQKEDLSDMVADHAAKQAKKRKKQQQDSSKTAKKYKEFKF